MLNPESVDYNAGIVRLLFTDEQANPVLKVYLSENDAWRLSEQIRDRCNMLAKKDRRHTDEKFDPNF
jgi:hypothetical protein